MHIWKKESQFRGSQPVEPGARQTKQLERQGRLISSKTTFGIAIVKIYTLYAYN